MPEDSPEHVTVKCVCMLRALNASAHHLLAVNHSSKCTWASRFATIMGDTELLALGWEELKPTLLPAQAGCGSLLSRCRGQELTREQLQVKGRGVEGGDSCHFPQISASVQAVLGWGLWTRHLLTLRGKELPERTETGPGDRGWAGALPEVSPGAGVAGCAGRRKWQEHRPAAALPLLPNTSRPTPAPSMSQQPG